MNTSEMVVAAPGRRRRRRHSAEFKRSVIEACAVPGVSIASVAMANGINANLLRRWVAEAEAGSVAPPSREMPAASAPSFIALPVAAPAQADIRIELQRAGTAITVTWPASAAADCATWLRELLR